MTSRAKETKELEQVRLVTCEEARKVDDNAMVVISCTSAVELAVGRKAMGSCPVGSRVSNKIRLSSCWA